MFRGCDAERLLAGNPTFVLDCIDDISTKAELIAYCSEVNPTESPLLWTILPSLPFPSSGGNYSFNS